MIPLSRLEWKPPLALAVFQQSLQLFGLVPKPAAELFCIFYQFQ